MTDGSKSAAKIRRRGARLRAAVPVAFVANAALVGPCSAHPHILIKARARLIFGETGSLVGVRNIWDFDKAFSAYAIQGYDKRRDGKPTRQDLQPLAVINVQSLARYNFFTSLKFGASPQKFGQPTDYFDRFANETLTLRFTLPLATPAETARTRFELDVYDPEYFAAIAFAKNQPITFVGGAPNCSVDVRRPKMLSPSLASELAAIPASQRVLPPNLFAVTQNLVNGATVSCK